MFQQFFLIGFNGWFFFFEDFWDSLNQLELYIDVVGLLGFGLVFGGQWCYGKWFDNWLNQNIVIFEFYLIVFSLYLWGY